MSRSCYTDDYGDDYPGQLNLFRANVRRSLGGKKGQARLRELRDALLALPVKELADEIFVAADEWQEHPTVCALGAWAVQYEGGDVEAASQLVPPDPDDEATAAAFKSKGWPYLVVLETIYENDRDQYIYEDVEGPHQEYWHYVTGHPHIPVRYGRPETPAERYVRVLAWVEGQILP